MLKKSQSSEIVDIWMKKDTPVIEVQSAEGYRRTIRQPTFFSNNVPAPDEPASIPIVRPFFAWEILDEFGEPDKVSLPDRVDRFLKAIYGRIAAEGNIKVEGKTENQLQEYLKTIKNNSPALELGQSFISIFRLYVPVGEHSVATPIEMYWGAAYEVVQVSPPLPPLAAMSMDTENDDKTFYETPALATTLQKYLELMSSIIFNAQRLHEGVYCSRAVQDTSTKAWLCKDDVANGAILLAVVVDALGGILRMIVETVRSLRDVDEGGEDIMGPASKISEHGKEACDLLKEARDQLIKEAEGRDKNGNIGPVVTPEALTISLIERLASGVLHNGTLDIIHLYEECLEHLVRPLLMSEGLSSPISLSRLSR